MSRILLADDSPHAQRMGERILREEGFEVVTVTDGNTAMLRLSDADPDVVLADAALPGKSGYEICRDIKSDARYKHIRVVLTAGLLKDFDERLSAQVRADGVLRKPFEPSAMIAMLKPIADDAGRDRKAQPPAVAVRVVTHPLDVLQSGGEADPERVRAAVTLALDAAMPAMIDRITEQVLIALRH